MGKGEMAEVASTIEVTVKPAFVILRYPQNMDRQAFDRFTGALRAIEEKIGTPLIPIPDCITVECSISGDIPADVIQEIRDAVKSQLPTVPK